MVNGEKLKRRVKDLPRGNGQHFPEMTEPSRAVHSLSSLSRCVTQLTEICSSPSLPHCRCWTDGQKLVEAERFLPPSIDLVMMAGYFWGGWEAGEGAIYYSELLKHSQGTLQSAKCTHKHRPGNKKASSGPDFKNFSPHWDLESC